MQNDLGHIQEFIFNL